jgi:hypothetical protein
MAGHVHDGLQQHQGGAPLPRHEASGEQLNATAPNVSVDADQVERRAGMDVT